MRDQATIFETKPASQTKTQDIAPFKSMLEKHDLELVRDTAQIMQINLGFLCNQTCRHCHLNAGPGRKENMGAQTLKEVVAYAQRSRFEAIDITGGASELHPLLTDLVQQISPLTARIMLRSNLSALKENMESEFVVNHIAKTTALARRIGFSGTPLFIIEGKVLPGYVPLEELEKLISDIRKSRM